MHVQQNITLPSTGLACLLQHFVSFMRDLVCIEITLKMLA